METSIQSEKGDTLFLLNYETNRLHGVFEAASDGRMNIEPDAFDGYFPAQVRIKTKIDCAWVDEGALLPLNMIEENGGLYVLVNWCGVPTPRTNSKI